MNWAGSNALADFLSMGGYGLYVWGSFGMGALVITHYNRILRYIKPDFVHVFVGGKIVEEGGAELAEKLEASGYEQWEQREEAA